MSKINLEPLGPKFFSDYLLLVNNEIVHQTTQPDEDFVPFSKEQIEKWLVQINEEKNRKDFAIIHAETKSFIGEVVLNQIVNSNCNIRIAILPKYFDMGYGTEAMTKAIKYGFEVLGLSRISLGVYSTNPRGVRVYEKCGFEIIEKIKVNDHLYEIKMEKKA